MSVNKVILVGNLGADPEVRYSAQGNAIANIRIATTRKRKNRDTGEVQENTEWHRVVFFQRLAEIAQQYLSKGSQVYVEGHLQTRKWQDQQGQDRYSTEIVGENLQMLGSRNGGGNSQQGGYTQQPPQQQRQAPPAQPQQQRQAPPPQPQYQQPQPQQQQQQQQPQQQPQQPQQAVPAQGGGQFYEDDIPF